MLSLGLKCCWIVTHLFALLSRAGNLGLAEFLLNKYLLAPPFFMLSFQKVWFLNFSPLQAPPIDLSLYCHHINRLFIYLYHADYFKYMFNTVYFSFFSIFPSKEVQIIGVEQVAIMAGEVWLIISSRAHS